MVTKCVKCGKKASINLRYGQQNYCDKHFIELVEKRVRKEIRKHYEVDFQKKYELYNDGSAEYEILNYFLNSIFENNLPIKTIKRYKDEDTVFQPTNLENEIGKFMQTFFQNKDFEFTNTLKPLRVVPLKEIKELKRILNIEKPVTNKHNAFIEELQKKYPSTKFSILKSLKHFENNKEEYGIKK